MRLPRLSGTKPIDDYMVTFRGLNETDQSGKGEFVDMVNMSGDRFPHLSPRKPRGTVRTLGKINGLLAREKMLWVDGTGLYYDGRKVGDVTDSEKQIVSAGAYVLIFPDKVYYNTHTDEFGSMENSYTSTGTIRWEQSYLTDTELDAEGQIYAKISASGIDDGFAVGDGIELDGFTEDKLNGVHVIKDIGDGWIKIIAGLDENGSQTATVTVKRKIPDMDYVTVAENRLWGCSSENHEVYASALGEYWNFNVFEGTANDSYASTIANDGEFTGAITYLGYVMFFKENSVHKIYGNKPSNFQIIEGQLRGVEKGSANSLRIVNEVLYYKSASGIMSFQGSLPSDVGKPIKGGYKNAHAGCVGNKYYISMQDAKGVYHLFVYDTSLGVWHKEDNTQAKHFTKDGAILYYAEGNTIKTVVGDDNEIIEWCADTSDYDYQMAGAKFVSRISVRCEVPRGSALEIWIQYDSKGVWKHLKSIDGSLKHLANVPLIPARCDHFKLRFKGYGNFAVHDMTLYISSGSNERRR